MVLHEKLFGPTHVFASITDGTPTLKRLFKVDVLVGNKSKNARRTKHLFKVGVPSEIEANKHVGTNSFFA